MREFALIWFIEIFPAHSTCFLDNLMRRASINRACDFDLIKFIFSQQISVALNLVFFLSIFISQCIFQIFCLSIIKTINERNSRLRYSGMVLEKLMIMVRFANVFNILREILSPMHI